MMAVAGIINLAAGLGMRLFTFEDKRMAWGASELMKQMTGVQEGRFYPIMVSMEMLLEFVGAILPSGVVGPGIQFMSLHQPRFRPSFRQPRCRPWV